MSRQALRYLVNLAEYSERYSDMVVYIKQLIKETGGRLSIEERSLLHRSYKYALEILQNSVRLMLESGPISGTRGFLEIARAYTNKLRGELHAKICEVVELIDNQLICDEDDDQVKVFYLCLKVNFSRFLLHTEDQQAAEKCRRAYVLAIDEARALMPANLLRVWLGSEGSSFFYYELEEHQRAYELAQTTFNEAIPHVHEAEEASRERVSYILDSIRNNIEEWKLQEFVYL